MSQLVQKSSEPFGELGVSASSPWAARRTTVACRSSVWMTRWLRPPGSTGPAGGIVDEFDADEFVLGKFQHREAPHRGFGHRPDDFVAETCIEGAGSFEVLDPEPDVQGPHPRPSLGFSVTGNSR